MDASALLSAYDQQLRTDAETSTALAVTPSGPLRLAKFPDGQGFVTYQELGSIDAARIRQLVAYTRAFFEADPEITEVEWKTRGHDHAPGLHDALVAAGFVPGDAESVMVGEASSLVVDVALPEGVTLRRVHSEPDVRSMFAMLGRVFPEEKSQTYVDALLSRLGTSDGVELWVAEARGEIVSAGRLEPVADSDFAGIWGGGTLAHWRGRGIYRALTSARARSALALGKTLIHSDSTEFSRPILERSGLTKVSTTTPYIWRR